MENASKALIIAGSILVSIVIITLGVMIVSNVTETIQNNSNLSEQEISTYNSPFEAYIATRSGTQVKALCDKIRNHNSANPDDSTRNIKVVYGSEAPETEAALDAVVTAASVNTIKTSIKSGKTYTVSFSYDPNSGLIVGAYIVEKK